MSLSESVAGALAIGAQQGSWVAAEAALAPLDPLVRLAARRKLRALVERARRLTTLDHPSHVLRVAALLAGKGSLEADADDEAAVELELSHLGLAGVPRQKPFFLLGALAGLALIVALGFVGRSWLRPFDVRETPVGKGLGDGLTGFVVALSKPEGARQEELAEARALALSSDVAEGLGETGLTTLKKLLDQAERAASSRGATTARDDRNAFLAAANELLSELGKRKQPYFVDAEVLERGDRLLPLLLVSYVQREVEVEAGGKQLRALHLWRLDRLRVGWPVLGYARPRTPAALVLLDQVESDLVEFVLPALPPGETIELVDEQTRLSDEAWVAEAERRAAEILRRHYARELSEPHVVRVGQLLARRRALVESWRKSLSSQNRWLAVPRRLIPEYDYSSDLERRVSREKLREWDALHEELLSVEVLAAFEKLRDRYTLSIERHEIQHRLDFQRGMMPVPQILADLVGLENPLDAPEGSLGAMARHELSAYLAELAQGPDAPLLALVLMSRIALDRGSLGSSHSYAVIALLIGVGRELGIDVSAFDRYISREPLSKLMLEIGSREPAAIREAAERCYRAYFAEPVPAVTRRTTFDHPSWRH